MLLLRRGEWWVVSGASAARQLRVTSLSHIALAPYCAVTASSRTCKYCRRTRPTWPRQPPTTTRPSLLSKHDSLRLYVRLRTVVLAISCSFLVPWYLPTRWINFTFWVSPIYPCGRVLANVGRESYYSNFAITNVTTIMSWYFFRAKFAFTRSPPIVGTGEHQLSAIGTYKKTPVGI